MGSDYNVPNNVVVTSVYTVFRVFWPSEGKQLSQLTFNLHNAGQSQPSEAAASVGVYTFIISVMYLGVISMGLH